MTTPAATTTATPASNGRVDGNDTNGGPSPTPPSTTTADPQPPSLLPESVLRLVRGEATGEEKAAHYDSSLRRWWGEYAARKNDEEHEHVADSLMYDERLHLPRTTRRPDVCDGEGKREAAAAAAAAETTTATTATG